MLPSRQAGEIIKPCHLGGSIFYDLINGGAAYSPLLVPKRIDGLLAAGRCVTSTWEAHMSTRNTVSCMAQGQAAGTAAALCAAEGNIPRSLNVKILQETLKQQGVILE